MKVLFWSFTLCLFLSIHILPQEATNWRIFSDKKNLSSAVILGNKIFCGGEGGAFSFLAGADSTYEFLTKAEGLNGSPITSVMKDSGGKIWFGSKNGKIDVFDPNTSVIKTLHDISATNFTLKQINEMTLRGDSVIVSCDFGVVVYNSKTLEVVDSYTKFGSLISNIRVTTAVFAGKMLVGTANGFAAQKAGATNLSAPESWEVLTGSSGLPSSSIFKIAAWNSGALVATAAGFAFYNGTVFQSILPEFANSAISDFFITGDSVLIIQGSTLYIYTNSVLQNYAVLPNTELVRIAGKTGSTIWLATKKGLFEVNGPSSYKIHYPDGPYANLFYRMTVDAGKNLWVATGTDLTGIGYFRYDGKKWENKNKFTDTNFPSNAIVAVHTSGLTSYLGTWGSGFLRITPEGVLTHFNSTNTPIRGIQSNTDFIVIPGLSSDSKNNLWVLNHDAVDRKTLHCLTPDSVWYQFANPVDSNLHQYSALYIDQNDTKWFLSNDPQRIGLFYFNENKTFTKSSDDKYGYVSAGTELTGKTINTLAFDRRGEMWVGTNLGVYVLSNPGVVLNTNPTIRFNQIFSLRQYNVSAIVVDPVNRKWIGTNQGLLLVSPDGTTLIDYYTASNSALLSDDIKSLSIDPNTGTVYVGQDGGLVAFNTPAINPATDFNQLTCYPNPFIPGKTTGGLTVDGLIKDSELKIITVSGRLVKHIITPGGRIGYWDGRNEEGEYVQSGVYFIIAYDKEGNSVSSTKVLVIRE